MTAQEVTSRRRPGHGLVAIAALVVAMVGALIGAPIASAQATPPTLEVTSHVLDDTNQFTATISLDPGADLGAVSGLLEYEQTALAVTSCAMGELGVCHNSDKGLAFAAIAPQGFAGDASFVSVQFAVLTPGLMTDLVLTVDTAVTVEGAPIDGVVAFSGIVVPGALGGLNGDVMDVNNIGLFGMQVCAIGALASPACTVSTGLGAFVIDGLPSGDYSLVVSDPNDLLETQSSVVTVIGSDVTTGISVTMAPPGLVETPVVPVVQVPETEVPVELPSIQAEAGEIAVQITAANGAFAIFGANVCATMPLVGTQQCGFSDADGVARLQGLAPGNYELSATDPAGRFGLPETVFVGLNSSEGVVAALQLPAPDLGEPPEALAFVDRGLGRSESSGLIMTGLALAVMSSGALVSRRRR